MVWLSILVLILGVAVLSAKKPEVVKNASARGEEDEEQGESSKDDERYDLATLSREAPALGADSDSEEEGDLDGLDGKTNGFASAKGVRHAPSPSVEEFGSFVESEPLASSPGGDAETAHR